MRLEVPITNLDWFIVPTTRHAEQLGAYSLTIFSSCELEISTDEAPHNWSYQAIDGSWDSARNGGCRRCERRSHSATDQGQQGFVVERRALPSVVDSVPNRESKARDSRDCQDRRERRRCFCRSALVFVVSALANKFTRTYATE